MIKFFCCAALVALFRSYASEPGGGLELSFPSENREGEFHAKINTFHFYPPIEKGLIHGSFLGANPGQLKGKIFTVPIYKQNIDNFQAVNGV
jgi:hypothetical protein